MLATLLALILAVNHGNGTMSAIITTPPILIDPVYYSRMTFTVDSTHIAGSGGPYQGATGEYLFLEGNAPSTGFAPLNVFKSISGVWTLMDGSSANKPPTPTNNPAQVQSVYDPIGGIIYVAYQGDGSTNRFTIYSFSTNTDKWLTPGAQSALNCEDEDFVMARLSNGDIYVFYTLISFGFHTIYEKYSGGVWSSATIDGTANGAGVESVVVDSSDRMTLLYLLTNGGNKDLKAVQISSAGAVGAPVTLDTQATFAVGRGVIWGSKIVFPANNFTGGGTFQARVYEGTPLAAPVWSTRVVGSTVPNTYTLSSLDATLDVNGNLVVGWEVVQPGAPFGSQTDVIYIATDTGSGFSAQQLLYDVVANPPTLPAGFALQSGLHTIQLLQQSNGDWLALVALDVFNSGTSGSACAGFIVGVPSTPPPLPTVTPGDGGRMPVALAPNQFDFCLHREYRLFCNIDYDLKGCARLPACFRVDEREWGDQG